MYRNDYSRVNRSPVTNSTRLYDARFYIMTSEYRVYICLQNGTDPTNPQGNHQLTNQLTQHQHHNLQEMVVISTFGNIFTV